MLPDDDQPMPPAPASQDLAIPVPHQAPDGPFWERDRVAAALGMMLEHSSPGKAVVTMTVGPDMLNAHGMCHGGMIFSLADSTFGVACNGYDHVTVGVHCDISYLRPARLGDRLTAHARESHREGRNGIYDVEVRNDRGEMVALFRGRSREMRR